MTYRVIQWATGEMGKDLLRQVIDHPLLELAGVRVYAAHKDSADAGDLVERPPTGIRCTTDTAVILATKADVVLHSPLYAFDQDAADRDVIALLRSGKNVISNHAGFFYPPATTPDRVRALQEACMAGRTTLYAAGWQPALLTANLIPLLTNACSDVRVIWFTEFVHFVDRNRPEFVFPVMGFGSDPAGFDITSKRAVSYFAKYTETLSLVAAVMGLTPGHATPRVEIRVADRDFEIAAGLVKKGTVASICWSVRLETDGPPLHFESRRTVDPTPPPGWELKRMHRVHIEGDPSIRTDTEVEDTFLAEMPRPFSPMMRARAICAPMINAIAEVVAAPPGFLMPKVFTPWDRRALKTRP